MAQLIKQGNIFGRVGTGIGRGLAEQIPKEVERSRLSSGLKELSNKKDLSPFQQFSELSSIPGVTPQMIESGSKLLRQQGINQALMNKSGQSVNQDADSKIPKSFQKSNVDSKNGEDIPSITSRSGIEAAINNKIPRTFEEKQQLAGELMQKDPALYGGDPDRAFSAAESIDASEIAINQALQNQRKTQQDVQDNIVKGLKQQQADLNSIVPGNVYSEVEDQAINSVKSKQEGGEGLTEQQAKKKYGDVLDKVSRDYNALKSVGSVDFVFRGIDKIKQNLKSIRSSFKDRDDLENLADSYITQQQISPSKAYYLAYPPSENKDLNNALVNIPKIDRNKTMLEDERLSFPEIENKIKSKTLDVSKKLAEAMGKEGSPLAISEELKSRGFDSDLWFDYLDKNRKKLGLTERQARELDKPRNNIPTLNDNWLFLFSGLDKLVEQ